jgi:hypothetical protein
VARGDAHVEQREIRCAEADLPLQR